MSDPNQLQGDAVREFRYDLTHRDDADPEVDSCTPQVMIEKELGGIIAGIDPLVAHDLARQAMDIDYPGTELDPYFKPPEHPLGL
jgi:hypothetical protein